MRRRPKRRKARPIHNCPLAQDSGIERMRPAIVGDIHTTSEGEMSAAANSVTSPSTRVRAVAADDASERDRAVVAPLRIPAGVPPEQDLHD